MKPKFFNDVIDLANAQESKEEGKKLAVLTMAEQLVSFMTLIRLSEVHKKAGAELVSNGIVGRNLGTKQKVAS